MMSIEYCQKGPDKMINFKQEELIESLIKDIREKYPEVELVKVVESPEDPETLWIRVSAPED